MRGLYAIFDVDAFRARGADPFAHAEPIAEALLAARPCALQLRAKHEGGRAALSLLRRLRPLARKAAVPLFANDRADLAVLAEADGVHVGQDDLAIEDVRRIAASLLVGVSTHDPSQLAGALAARPSYVAFGPVFATASKENPDPVVGLDGVRASARALGGALPLVAIGGIARARVAEVVAAGASSAAVISDLVVVRDGVPDVDAIAERGTAIAAAFRGARSS